MPGSTTTPGRPDARADASRYVAFRSFNGVDTQIELTFTAQWLAYALPYRRFAIADARLGADVARYSFIVVDSHHLLLAGLTGALNASSWPSRAALASLGAGAAC
jgi:hypothetical protein